MRLQAKRIQRRFMTLLEIMIVIAILFGLGGIVAVNLKETLVKQRFKNEVGVVVDYLRFAQNLMLVMGKDVHVYFEETPEKIVKMSLEIAGKPVEEQKWIVLSKKPVFFKYIRYAGFNDQSPMYNPNSAKIDIKFMSRGFAMSKSVLILSTAENQQSTSLTQFIALVGYPKHLVPQTTPSQYDNDQETDSSLDQSLTALTYKEMEEQVGLPIQ